MKDIYVFFFFHYSFNVSEGEIIFTLYGIQQKHIINFFHVISPKALVTNWQIEYLSENENRKMHITQDPEWAPSGREAG